jgi:DNA-binding NtrC family response regulator
VAQDWTTKTDLLPSLSSGRLPLVPVLTIVYHSDPTLLGQRCVVPDGEELVLGRSCGLFGPDALADAAVSRRHARVFRQGEQVSVSDLCSRNGTFVNGARVAQQAVRFGDVLGIGPALLLLQLGPALHQPLRWPTLIGVSHALSELGAEIDRVATEPTSVLIEGETGVGKELVATEIHRRSGVTGRLVTINCGAVADGVVHSELFGHVRGAFSGAAEERLGLVRAAQGGTLFLDEVGDASGALQVSLLRLLEQRECRPVGSDRTYRTDARFLAATHVPLEPAVQSGRFRQDLYARLSRWVIHVPALRERREDIIPLALHLAEKRAGRPMGLERELALALLGHRWPSNVRELDSVVARALAEAGERGELRLGAAVAAQLAAPGGRPEPAGPAPRAPLGRAPTDPRAASPPVGPPGRARSRPQPRPSATVLRDRLAALGNNLKALAVELGVSRRTAYRWLDEAGVDLQAIRDEQRRR